MKESKQIQLLIKTHDYVKELQQQFTNHLEHHEKMYDMLIKLAVALIAVTAGAISALTAVAIIK